MNRHRPPILILLPPPSAEALYFIELLKFNNGSRGFIGLGLSVKLGYFEANISRLAAASARSLAQEFPNLSSFFSLD